jgi:succinate dehydrogenase / fumarate reductase flavoprotein subunit
MERSESGLQKALSDIPALKEEFDKDLKVLGDDMSINQSLEKAGRVEDFFELADLMCRDALQREESCGAHFRVEYQTPDGEALRNDEEFAYVSSWKFNGPMQEADLIKEPLEFEYVKPTTRSYK